MKPGEPDSGGPVGGGSGDQPEAAATAPTNAEEATSAEASPAAAESPTTIVEVPPDVAADPLVDTETVEVPPVTIASVDRPAGPRRVGGRVAAVVGVVAVLAIAAVAYVGYSLNQDLASTRSTLASTESDLGSTQTTLDDTSATLAATKTELADRTTEQGTLDAEVRELSGQVATQTQCVTLQEEALAELILISELQTTNFNRTAEGSAWATADKKRGDNISVALDEFYEAYRAAFQGSTGTARSHSDKGKAAQAKIAEAEAQEVAELNLVDQKAAEIQAAIDALEQQLTVIATTCEGMAP